MANQGNRVYVSTATTGTGTISLGGAVSAAFTTFAEAGIANGTVIRSYCIEDGNNFEIGSGTYTAAGTTLTRTTVFLSKIAGVSGTTKITLSGSATVRIIAAAEDIVTTTGDNVLTGDLSWTGSAWTAYTPTLTATAGTFTTASAAGRFKQNGTTVEISVLITITTAGSGTFPVFTLPVTPFDIDRVHLCGNEFILNAKMVQARKNVLLAGTLVVSFYDNTVPSVDGTNFRLSGLYEAA